MLRGFPRSSAGFRYAASAPGPRRANGVSQRGRVSSDGVIRLPANRPVGGGRRPNVWRSGTSGRGAARGPADSMERPRPDPPPAESPDPYHTGVSVDPQVRYASGARCGSCRNPSIFFCGYCLRAAVAAVRSGFGEESEPARVWGTGAGLCAGCGRDRVPGGNHRTVRAARGHEGRPGSVSVKTVRSGVE